MTSMMSDDLKPGTDTYILYMVFRNVQYYWSKILCQMKQLNIHALHCCNTFRVFRTCIFTENMTCLF